MLYMERVKGKKIKELHMDAYVNEPYMLLARIVDKNISHCTQNNRVVLRKKDDTVIMNIPLDEIVVHTVKEFGNTHYQVLFDLDKIQYKVFASF